MRRLEALTKGSAVVFVKTLMAIVQSLNQFLRLLKCVSSTGSVGWRYVAVMTVIRVDTRFNKAGR